MFFFFSSKVTQIGYPDIQNSKSRSDVLIINTLPANEQECLISGTLACQEESTTINQLITRMAYNTNEIIVYGRNTCDDSCQKKAEQLVKLGFRRVHVYSGGLFEWLLLQDVYGSEWFPTTSYVTDILKYKPGITLR